MATRDSHLILRTCTKTEVCAFDWRIETIRRQTSRNDMETDIPVCANTRYSYLNSDRYLQWRMINNIIYCVIIGTRLTV